MGLLRRWRERRRESKAEARAMAQMRSADDVQAPEPKEAKLSQMRD